MRGEWSGQGARGSSVKDSPLLLLWGKTDGSGSHHPLVCHMLDVGTVAQTLAESSAWSHVASRLAAAVGVHPHTAARLGAFLASLHDLGKAAPTFHAKSPSHLQNVLDAGLLLNPDRPRDFHHGSETYASLPSFLETLGMLRVEDGDLHLLCDRLAHAVAAHHGTFFSGRVYAEVPPHARDTGDFEAGWREVRRAVIERLAVIFLGDAAPITCRPVNLSAASMLLSGIVIFADWVGSDVGHFPPAGRCELDEHVSRSFDRARRAIDCLAQVWRFCA